MTILYCKTLPVGPPRSDRTQNVHVSRKNDVSRFKVYIIIHSVNYSAKTADFRRARALIRLWLLNGSNYFGRRKMKFQYVFFFLYRSRTARNSHVRIVESVCIHAMQCIRIPITYGIGVIENSGNHEQRKLNQRRNAVKYHFGEIRASRSNIISLNHGVAQWAELLLIQVDNIFFFFFSIYFKRIALNVVKIN